MAELTACTNYLVSCPLCGRTAHQTTFCKEVLLADGTFSYNMDSREQATH